MTFATTCIAISYINRDADIAVTYGLNSNIQAQKMVRQLWFCKKAILIGSDKNRKPNDFIVIVRTLSILLLFALS